MLLPEDRDFETMRVLGERPGFPFLIRFFPRIEDFCQFLKNADRANQRAELFRPLVAFLGSFYRVLALFRPDWRTTELDLEIDYFLERKNARKTYDGRIHDYNSFSKNEKSRRKIKTETLEDE